MLDAIRHAVERGDFARAERLWGEWSRHIGEAGRLSEAEWVETNELYCWSKEVLHCTRAQVLDQLNTLHAAGAYGAQQLLGAGDQS